MSKACLVCKAMHLEMIGILRHPGKLDYMLNCLLGLQAQQDDYLCNKCCDDVISAFDAKQKFHELSLLEPKVFRGNGVIVKDDVDQSEKTVSAVPEVKIEGLEEDMEDATVGPTDINKCEMIMKPGLESKEQRDAFEKRPASQGSVNVKETMSSKEDFNITTLDSGCKQINRRAHFKRAESISIKDSTDEDQPNDERDVGEISFRCTRSRSRRLRNHIGSHNSNTNSRSAYEKPYVCCKCEKSFTSLHKLKLHESTHTGEKPYKCFECGRAFAKTSQLKIHKMIHTGERPYKCSQCEESFITSHRLKAHKMIHIGEKPYKCDECKKGFVTTSGLKLHKKNHTEERPYKCSQCEKSFITSYRLKAHKKNHTEERPYKCSQCEKSFITSYRLKAHKMIHTEEKPYKCDECKKGFVTTSGLKLHKMIHTEERPYKCSKCEKSFITSHRLKAHKMIHTEEKP